MKTSHSPGIQAEPSLGVFAFGAVEPDFPKRAVVCKQLSQLRHVKRVVVVRAISRLVAVPGREVEARVEPLRACRLCQSPHHVPFAVSPRTADYVMLGVGAEPERKPVVVFGREEHRFETGLPRHTGPLPRAEVRRLKHAQVFRTVASFPVGKRVDGEVQKRRLLVFLPLKLPLSRNGQKWLGRGHSLLRPRIDRLPFSWKGPGQDEQARGRCHPKEKEGQRHRGRLASVSSTSSKGGIIRTDCTQPLTISRR